jgi:hypothetical protein
MGAQRKQEPIPRENLVLSRVLDSTSTVEAGRMSLIVRDRTIEVPGVTVINWQSGDPGVRHCRHHRPRKHPVQAIVLHTSRGVEAPVVEALQSDHGRRLAHYQATTERQVSWHLTVCRDGTVLQQADLERSVTWHAGHANAWSVGIELAQAPRNPAITRAQIEATVKLCDVITAVFSIPRMACFSREPREYWQRGGGRIPSGVVGHRNLTRSRGPGDPGDHVMSALRVAGYEPL